MNGLRHDNRHTLVTEPAESGTGDEVIMSIAGHISRTMLSRYAHVRIAGEAAGPRRNRSAPARGRRKAPASPIRNSRLRPELRPRYHSVVSSGSGPFDQAGDRVRPAARIARPASLRTQPAVGLDKLRPSSKSRNLNFSAGSLGLVLAPAARQRAS